jgi:hypothetical protein
MPTVLALVTPSLTTAQQTTLRNAIKADTDPAVIAAYAARNLDGLADLYNTVASPDVLVWRRSIRPAELNNAVVWSEYAVLTVALQNCYLAMVNGVSSVDATISNIRGGFSTIFSGKVTLTNLTALAQRQATKFESLYVTAQVVDVSLDGHQINPQELGDALFNPDGTPR